MPGQRGETKAGRSQEHGGIRVGGFPVHHKRSIIFCGDVINQRVGGDPGTEAVSRSPHFGGEDEVIGGQRVAIVPGLACLQVVLGLHGAIREQLPCIRVKRGKCLSHVPNRLALAIV